MDKIEVGEYVRTNNGIIGTLIKISEAGKGIRYAGEFITDTIISIYTKPHTEVRLKERDISKHSKNKIEVLEDSDLVELEYKSPKYRERITRVFEVSKIDDGYITFENRHCEFFIKERDKKITDKICKNIKIKSILTHEEYNSRKYNFEEE